MEQNAKRTIIDVSGNPAPLGLMAFGITTVLLNLSNAGMFAMGSMILAMGIFFGGIGQVIAGIMEWKKGNTFGTLAFTSYGLFWLSLATLLILQDNGIAAANSASATGAYLFMWGLFTLLMFVGTLKLNRALMVVFGTLFVLFFLLAIKDFTGSSVVGTIAGYEGVVCGLSAVYASIAQVWNEVYGRTVLPIGQVKK